jgi:hypothetical protein
MFFSFASVVLLLQTRSRLTLNSKLKSERRILESNISESNFAKNFFANVDWLILMRFQWVSNSMNLYSLEYTWTRSFSIEDSLSYLASNLSTRERWNVFYYVRSIASKRFRIYWFDDKTLWSCIYVESHHETCHIHSRFRIFWWNRHNALSHEI